jgi:hypothetical protein
VKPVGKMMVWPNSGESSFWTVPIRSSLAKLPWVRANDYVALGTFTTRNCNDVSYLGDCAVIMRHGSCVSFGKEITECRKLCRQAETMRASVGAESNATASPCVKQRHVVINLVSLVSV